jgi:outer membrane protein assembly factor BamD
MKFSSIYLLFILFFAPQTGKAQLDKKAETAFNFAAKLQKSSRYEEALVEFQSIESNYPYSKYAKLSKLRIADVHYAMKNYIQAHYQYKYYHELYPREDNSDYALFRAGLSQYKQIPKAVDRDISLASEVLKTWRETLVKHPGTKYTNKILEYQQKVIKKMGQKELYIAKFYHKQDRCISAQGRIKKLFRQYPTFLNEPKALKIAIDCARQLEDEPAERKYKELLKRAESA